jgi:hypothetical protein
MALGKKTGGRQKGTPNKLSTTVKDNFIAVFADLNGQDLMHMKEWAKENPTQFYNLYAKLLPLQLAGDQENPIQTITKIELVPLQ